MQRRLLVVSLAVTVLAGCGSGGETPSPAASVAPPVEATQAPAVATEAPSAEVTPVEPTSMSAVCNAVGLRKLASSKGALIARIGAGATVRVVEVVPGDAYKAGNCGSDGDTWLKIDQVDGKGVKALYGVTFAYTAAGFFK
jgi:hypothetical protein